MRDWSSCKCFYDATLLSKISTAFERFGLRSMPVLDNKRAHIIVALFSQDFITSCNALDEFKEILNKMHRRVDMMKVDKYFINTHVMSRFYEWAKLLIDKHTEGKKHNILNKVKEMHFKLHTTHRLTDTRY